MDRWSNDFYLEKRDFFDDIKNYYSLMKKELEYVLDEVSNSSLNSDFFYLGIIPFKSEIEGILYAENGGIRTFECDDVRAEIGSTIHELSEEIEFEIESKYLSEEEINIKKCELYHKDDNNFPWILRHGGQGNVSCNTLIKKRIKNMFNASKALFISNWIEFGPFCVFFVLHLNAEICRKYWKYSNTREKNSTYKYFLNTLIDNFFEKWLEFVYYGLNYSTINYISDAQAIITASANDMFESRQIPKEHIFNKIANCEYERTPCKGTIVFGNGFKKIVKFNKKLEVSMTNAKKIRKLLEMSNENTCLVAELSSDSIIGLANYNNYKGSYQIKFEGINRWELSLGTKPIIQYCNGQFKMPASKIDRELFIEKCEDVFHGKYDKKIVQLVEIASTQSHGTIVIITPYAVKECEEIVNEGKGTAIKETNLLSEGKDIVLGLSSIDGAIMIDAFGNCSGIGLILSNHNNGTGDPGRGARYNSAVNYKSTHKDSVVVVVSEDGTVDIL